MCLFTELISLKKNPIKLLLIHNSLQGCAFHHFPGKKLSLRYLGLVSWKEVTVEFSRLSS